MPRTGSQRTGIFSIIKLTALPARLFFGSIERAFATNVRGICGSAAMMTKTIKIGALTARIERGRCNMRAT